MTTTRSTEATMSGPDTSVVAETCASLPHAQTVKRKASALQSPVRLSAKRHKLDSVSVPESDPRSKTQSKRRTNLKPKSKSTPTSNTKPELSKSLDDHLDLARGLNHAIGRMHAPLLADYLAQRSRRFQPDLSMLEEADRRIPG